MSRYYNLPLAFLLAFAYQATCQTDIKAIFTQAAQHLTSILGTQYQYEEVSATICFEREDILTVAGEQLECKDQPQGKDLAA